MDLEDNEIHPQNEPQHLSALVEFGNTRSAKDQIVELQSEGLAQLKTAEQVEVARLFPSVDPVENETTSNNCHSTTRRGSCHYEGNVSNGGGTECPIGNNSRLPSSQTTDQTTELQPLNVDHSPELSKAENAQPPRKRQRMSVSPERILAEESQDSLAGKMIEVAGAPSPKCGTKRHISDLSRADCGSLTPLARSTSPKLRTSLFEESIAESLAPSVAPPSSMRCTRSGRSGGRRRSSIARDGIRVLFASSTAVGNSKVSKKFLLEQNVKIVHKLTDATCLCIGNGELKKTSKVLLAVLLGVDIIWEDWVTESIELQKLSPIESYLARDPAREKQWGIDLAEAIERGKEGIRIFDGWNIVITSSAKKGLGLTSFTELKEVALSAGAESVMNTLPKKRPQELLSTLIVGTQADRRSLKEWRCYTKDIVGLSVLRGKLDLENDEFLIPCEVKETNSKMKQKR